MSGSRAWPFACPVCREPLLERSGKSLVCANRHSYDIARQGYVNLLRKKPDTLYEDKALFEARRAVYEAGFFDTVIEAFQALLPEGTVLDAGCGEGSLLHRLARGNARTGVGVDISRPAVQLAARAYPDAFWCVGDLCDLPLTDASLDAIVNMLTPANYTEFARTLGSGGVLLKAVPGPAHLREIRLLAGKAAYAHTLEETLGVFEKRFALLERRSVRYAIACDEALAANVYAMTPLTAGEERRRPEAGEITVDVTVLAGKKKEHPNPPSYPHP